MNPPTSLFTSIPDSPTASAECLERVADIIEFFPHLHDQGDWGPNLVQAGDTCDTSRCLAGWAVHLRPSLAKDHVSWSTAGADALGLDYPLALRLFYSCEDGVPHGEILRRLAKLPEPERDTGALVEICDDLDLSQKARRDLNCD